MSETAHRQMTVDEFLVWAEGRPGRYELVEGRVLSMAPERVRHTRIKGDVYLALRQAIEQARLLCEVMPDGATVRIDRRTAFEPDALVYCGQHLPDDALGIPHPVIVVEVLSPTTSGYDKGGKLAGYFTVPSIQHYLMVDPDRRVAVHHRREGDAIATHIVPSGALMLDPPGIEVDVATMIGSG